MVEELKNLGRELIAISASTIQIGHTILGERMLERRKGEEGGRIKASWLGKEKEAGK